MITINKANPTAAEERTSLVNASDGAGLHLQGGAIDIASPPDLGSKFSFELVLKADEWPTTSDSNLIHFGNGGNFLLYGNDAVGGNLGLYDGTSFKTLGVTILDDLKVHHLVLTVDGTAAILYDNGNQVATATISLPTIDSCADAKIGSNYASATTDNFIGNIYRCRFYNKALEPDEVQTAYERADVPFASQYGSQTELVTNGNFAADSNWSKESGWTISGGKAVCATSSTNAIYQTGVAVGGNKYRVTYTISDYSSGGIYLDSQGGAAVGVAGTDGTLRTANGTYTEEITIARGGNLIVFRGQASTTSDLKLDDVSVVRIGCISDYDLAFANPKNSFKINDRSGAADGTASNDGTNPTGISQVQVIKQLNATAARIGTTAATPADGQILTSGDIGVGGSPSTTASTSTIEAVNSGTARVLMKSTGTGGREYGLWTSTSGNLGFFDYTAGANRISISSTGLATFSGGINLGNQTISSYQTGTWNPFLYYQDSTGVTIGGTAYASQGVSDYTSQYGHYVRVGKLVHVEGYLKVNVQNTGSFAADNIGISGLPFAHRNLTDANCLLTVNSTGGGGTISGGVLSANSTIAVMQTISGTGNLGATVGANSALRVWINGTYFTEA